MPGGPPRQKRLTEEERKTARHISKLTYSLKTQTIRVQKETWEKWKVVKELTKSRTNDEVATLLIDTWEKLKMKYEDSGNVDNLASTSTYEQTDLKNDNDGQNQYCDPDMDGNSGLISFGDIIAERKAVCADTELLKLANLRIENICTQQFCNEIVTVTARYMGTSAQLNWTCSANHEIYTWNSQLKMNATPVVDLYLCSAMSSSEYPGVRFIFSNIGIEMMKPLPSNEVDFTEDRRKERPESGCPGQSIGQSTNNQLYPNMEMLDVKKELGSEETVSPDTNVEESSNSDMMLDLKEIKIEVNEVSQKDTETDSADVSQNDIETDSADESQNCIETDSADVSQKDIETDSADDSQMDIETESAMDEENNYIDYFSNTNKVLILPEMGDNGIEDCGIKSARVKKKGYRPNYAALEWKEDSDVENEMSDVISHERNEKQSTGDEERTDRKSDKTVDPDFNIASEATDSEVNSSGDDTINNDVADDDVEISDDAASTENEHGLAAKSKRPKESSSEGQLEPKRKRFRKRNTCRTKQEKDERKQNKTKKIWIKIHLADHGEKYKIETVESFERKNRKIDASENLYSCLVCQHFKCSSKDAIEGHLEKHVNKALECERCQYIGYCGTDINKHRRNCNQTDKALFICEICGYRASYDRKKYHMGRVHDIAAWKCQYCPDLFRTMSERLDHMRQIHPESCQYCESCRKSKQKMSKEEFQTHIQNCSSKVQCPICGAFMALSSMNKHMIDKHENIRKYQCQKCPYSAKSSKRLKTHLFSHENIHPHSCDQCSFTCVQPYQLKSHMRTHTGEKPYKCTQCKYAAAWNVQLKEHIKVHSMDTAVMCQKCDIIFKNEKTLNIHIKKQQCIL